MNSLKKVEMDIIRKKNGKREGKKEKKEGRGKKKKNPKQSVREKETDR
jgi:hypothetical protein